MAQQHHSKNGREEASPVAARHRPDNPPVPRAHLASTRVAKPTVAQSRLLHPSTAVLPRAVDPLPTAPALPGSTPGLHRRYVACFCAFVRHGGVSVDGTRWTRTRRSRRYQRLHCSWDVRPLPRK